MITAAGVIAKRLRAPRTEKDSARRVNAIQEGTAGAGQAEVFRRESIYEFAGGMDGRRDQNRARALHRNLRGARRRQLLQLPGHFGLHLPPNTPSSLHHFPASLAT